MKTLHLLSTVAAALLLAAGAAAAQGMQQQAPERAPAAQQNAPAEKMSPPMHAGERKGPETTGQASEQTKPGKNNKAELKSGNKAGSETTGQAPNASGKAEMNERERSGQSNNAMKNSTVGQGAAAGSAKLSTEQRTKITSVIRQQKVQPTRLNISVRVGARVPGTVRFYPLPTEVVEVYPEWRGYDYILVGDEILIVSPRTHLIVAVLEA